jgi:hypothetical protein
MVRWSKLGAIAAIGTGDAGGEQRYLESEHTKEGGEGSVEFVAKPAAAFADDLANERIFVAHDLTAEVDVKVFEGDSEEVGAMDLAQCFWRGTGDAGVVATAQVCGYIQHNVN